QRPQPLLLLLASPVAVEHLHIARIRRGAVEHLARPADPAHLLGAEGIFKVGELRPLELEALVDMAQRLPGGHEQIPQPRLARGRLQLLDDLDRLPAVAGGELLLIVLRAGADSSLDEFAHPVAVESLPFRKVKVHGGRFPSLCGARLLPETALLRQWRGAVPNWVTGPPRHVCQPSPWGVTFPFLVALSWR